MDNQFVAIAAAAGAVIGSISLIKTFSKDEKIRVISNQAECRRGLKTIREHCRDYPVIGFDCEWTNDYQRQPIALLQLQSYHGLCLLIRLPYVGILKELRELLENERILKVGVGVDLDAKYLFDDYRVHVKGTFDLRYMAVLAKRQPGKLAKMSEDYLKLELCKEYTPYLDWDSSDLSEQAIEYAAKDVHAAIELFKYFEELIYDGWMPRTSRERVKYVIDRFCSKFLDLHYNGAQGIPHALIRQRLSN